MIKIYSLYDGWNLTEITPVCKSIELSASLDQPARMCSFTMTYSITDNNQPRVQVGPGTLISITLENYGEIFRGEVVDRTLASSNQEETFTCYDYMRFIMKSSTSMNIKNMPPESVAAKACEEVNITPGDIVATGMPINRVCPDKTYYNIIMECYSEVSKQNGKQYIPIMRSDRLSIIEKGQIVSDYVLQSSKIDTYNNNLIDMSYKDSLENMINRVKIFDSEGNYVDEVEDSGHVQSYGVFQTTYSVEEDKDPYTVAQNKLYGFDQEIEIEALGNYSCLTGYAVKTKIWYLDILNNATVYINADTHTWECGTGKYTMKLTISFSNKMDLQEVDS
ncbi:terminase [Clostridium sp.]|uniref:XkdQ/YqbQ family protein n=1 Tax=Clostridium sp. TaxID=1506 RepID=UPI002634855C|nr:terminase [Clostridium sp.]